MRRLAAPLPLLLLLQMLIGAALSTDVVQALLTDTASVPSNTFSAAPCFPNNDTGLLDPTAQAADTGGDGDGFELNPANAFSDDAAYASNIDGAGDRHRFFDYGFSIDGTCAISGIEVRVDWWLDSVSGTSSMDVELSWDGGTSWTSAKTDSTETSSEHSTTLGGSADTWGRAWTVGELSDSSFRVRITTTSDSSVRDFFLDWVAVTVYYGP